MPARPSKKRTFVASSAAPGASAEVLQPPPSPLARAVNEFEERVETEIATQSSCRSLPFTLLLWAVFIVTQIGHRQVRLQNSLQRALTDVLTATLPTAPADANATATAGRRLLAAAGRSRTELSTTSTYSQALESVGNLAGIAKWIRSTLVPQLWTDGPSGRGVVHEFNRAFGGVRIQQTRLGWSECPGTPELRSVYNLTCYRGDRVHPSAAELASLPGLVVAEDGVQTYWLDLASDPAAVDAQIEQLWEGGWFHPGAQGIWVQCVLLNAQVNLLTYGEVEFEVDRAGRVKALPKVVTLPTQVYGKSWLIWAADVLLASLLLWLALAEVCSVCMACKRRSCKDYCQRPRSSILNWAVILCGAGFSAFFVFLAMELEVLATEIGSLPPPPLQAGAPGSAAGTSEWSRRHRGLDVVYDEVARLSGLLRGCELATFWYCLLLLLKFFTAFEGNPRLAALVVTLRECGTDLFHFMVVFLVVFVTFALGAYFLFGHQLKEWSNTVMACNSAYRAMLGDFDFEAMFKIAPVSSVVWFWLFMSLVFLVMLNMLLAIILETYAHVQEETADQSTLWQQLGQLQSQVAVGLGLKGGRRGSFTAEDRRDLLDFVQGRPEQSDLQGDAHTHESAVAETAPDAADEGFRMPMRELCDAAAPVQEASPNKPAEPQQPQTGAPALPKLAEPPSAPEAPAPGGLHPMQRRAERPGTPPWFSLPRQQLLEQPRPEAPAAAAGAARRSVARGSPHFLH